MNKIIEVALASAKPTVEQLLEVISATPNLEVATEILLGVYVEPTIEEKCKRVVDNETNIEFISFNKFTNEVSYYYNRVPLLHRWIPNDKEVLIENAIGTYAYSDDAAPQLKMTELEFKQSHTRHSFKGEPSTERFHSTMPLSAWNGITNYKR